MPAGVTWASLNGSLPHSLGLVSSPNGQQLCSEEFFRLHSFRFGVDALTSEELQRRIGAFTFDRDVCPLDRRRLSRDFHTDGRLRRLSEGSRRDDCWEKPGDFAPHATAPASSARACVTITAAPRRARTAIIAATSTSGHTAAVRATPNAAATTAQLPIRSLREHSQTDRILLSPDR